MSESEINLSQEWDGPLTWNKKDVSDPFMTMILSSVTMERRADVPDSDRGDFRRRRALDISSYIRYATYIQFVLTALELLVRYHCIMYHCVFWVLTNSTRNSK